MVLLLYELASTQLSSQGPAKSSHLVFSHNFSFREAILESLAPACCITFTNLLELIPLVFQAAASKNDRMDAWRALHK
jgi:hypothetical protein